MNFRVGCAGIIVEDTFCGPLAEMPREGLLVALDAMPVCAGGCAANVAIDLVKQGIEVDIAGCIGDDSAAKNLSECFTSQGISLRGLVVLKTLPTSKTVVLLIKGQDRRYLHLFGANAAFATSHVSRDWIKSLDVFYLGGLFALPALAIEELFELFSFCRREGIKTVLDVVIPQGTDASLLRAYEPLLEVTDYFLPNDDEAAALTGEKGTENQLTKFLSLGAGTVIITKGEGGAVAATGDSVWECGRYTMDCVDPSGAGDAFASGVIASLAARRNMPDLLQYASAIGASATRQVGTTGVMSRQEAEAFVLSQSPIIRHRQVKNSPSSI